ncbi:hypothetical protein EIP91_009886 [Steccherinum ochraceum]|uniref:Protein kinase domain-containing protein n=1 Tax=Steccherinum ochraceum TaxID=92696 RepID=A0A4R0RJD5_9APHY|nr:hypothetical protein EIP91_009886 [Steccherinum ochraceum]
MGRFDTIASSLLGCTIDEGRIQLVDILGSGSSGVVFLATDTADTPPARSYAVKCLIKAPRNSARSHCQWREIHHHRAMSSHPNVVTLHQVVEETDFIFLVMEHCPGGDLFSFLTDGVSFSGDISRVKNIFLQLVDALLACHKAGIYHRDVKPENIFCNADCTQVYLGDFGLSTTNDYSRNFGVGSFSYMSPECIRYDIQADAYSSSRNDIWALGPILTVMISGRNPWRMAASADEAFKAYLRDPNFLRKMLPISEGANLVLRHIFTRKEKNRASLEYIRHLVLQLETFYMSPEELSEAGEHTQRIAATYFRRSQHQMVYHETNTSYGHELGDLDERRVFSPERKLPEDVEPLSEIQVNLPHLRQQKVEIQQINRSQPTNPIRLPSDKINHVLLPDLCLPAPPPKIYLPPRHQRCAVQRSSSASGVTERVEAWRTGRVKRRVERVME